MRSMIPIVALLTVAACGGTETEQQQEPEEAAVPDALQTEATDSEEAATLQTDYPQMVAATPTWSGTVQVVGNDPFAQVVLATGQGASGAQLALIGDLREELGRLHGIRVTVSGSAVSNPQGAPPNAIDVDDFDVTSINEQPAYLGQLARRNGELWLEGTRRFRLEGVPADLQERDGAKIWVAGPIRGESLGVQSYGIVREP